MESLTKSSHPGRDLAESRLIYKVRCGSQAYGTNLPTSDEDFAGIFIPPVEHFFGLGAFDLLSDQSEDDHSYYSLRKYATLAVANNPNVLELLFVRDKDVLLSSTAATELRANRHLFLSQRCQKTFVGYAKAQLHRIRTHTKWLAQELEDLAILEPLFKEGKVTANWVAWRFGSNMLKRLGLEVEDPNHGPTSIPAEEDILHLFRNSHILLRDRKDSRFFDSDGMGGRGSFQKHVWDEDKKKRDQYVTWMAERNPIRHETELKFGYDTKHAMHLVRLLRAGYEILTTGDLNVYRPDAAELLAIRAGKWTYEEVTKYADEMVEKIDNLAPGRGLQVPVVPDVKKIDSLIVDITTRHLFGSHGDHT